MYRVGIDIFKQVLTPCRGRRREEGIEREQNDMDRGILQGNEADTATRPRKRHNCKETSVKALGNTETSDQWKHSIRTSDYASEVALHAQDEAILV